MQHFVASRVPKAVVHALEPIQVKNAQPQGYVEPTAQVDLLAQHTFAFSSIQQAREHVVRSKLLQCQLGIFSVCDVLHHAYHP